MHYFGKKGLTLFPNPVSCMDAEAKKQYPDRRLAAVMFTDMVGYTALSQTDEALALEVLKRHNKLLRPLFPKYHGREIKTVGDSFLVEFESALDATVCAIEIQKLLHDYNLSAREERKIKLRIGIHLGDVVHESEDIFGDAVNIASRVEQLARPEGICVSQQVFDQIHNKLYYELDKLSGQPALKNVKFETNVYSVVLPWESRARGTAEDKKARLDRLRVAVLPFKNMSPDPQDDYFADGMTEELISTLSAVKELRVVSRTSITSYKDSPKRLGDIGTELMAGSIVEGSVRKAGTQIRVTVQLLDANTDEHLWSEKYDRRLDDIFAIQSDISERVAKALSLKLTESEKERVSKEKTRNMSAFQNYLLGNQLLLQASEPAIRKSIELFRQAVATDSEFAEAYNGLARAYELLGHHSHMAWEESYRVSRDMVERALKIDGDLAEGHATLGYLALVYDWNLLEAEREFKKAMELDASNAFAHRRYARCLAAQGRLTEAVIHAETAADLDPLNPSVYVEKGEMYYLSGRDDDAFKTWKKAQELFPNHDSLYFFSTLARLARGELEEAQREFSHVSQPYREEPLGIYLQGALFGYLGKKEEALAMATRLQTFVESGRSSGDLLAGIYAALGDADEFFKWAEVAVKLRHWELYVLKNHDKFIPKLRSDSRWNELFNEAGIN
jgi:adenylate cyclase